jgi:hypothetical protein
MARMSREKGRRGEVEVVNLAKAHGLDARRTSQLQCDVPWVADVSIRQLSEAHLEVKRDERMAVDAMVRQATAEAATGKVPMVFWRRNGGKWRADVPLDWLFELIAKRP